MAMLGTRYQTQGSQGPGCRHKRPADQVAVIKNVPCAGAVLCVCAPIHPSRLSVKGQTTTGDFTLTKMAFCLNRRLCRRHVSHRAILPRKSGCRVPEL